MSKENKKENKKQPKKIVKKIYHPKPNWLGLTPWVKLKTPLIFACCDCGLVHDLIFKVEKDKIYWRAKRNKKITLEFRNGKKIKEIVYYQPNLIHMKETNKENKEIKVKFVLDKSSGLYNSVIIKPENKEESWEEEFDKQFRNGASSTERNDNIVTFIKDLISKTEDRVRKEIIENK